MRRVIAFGDVLSDAQAQTLEVEHCAVERIEPCTADDLTTLLTQREDVDAVLIPTSFCMTLSANWIGTVRRLFPRTVLAAIGDQPQFPLLELGIDIALEPGATLLPRIAALASLRRAASEGLLGLLQPRRILVVDDDEFDRAAVCAAVRELGLIAVEASTGDDALLRLREAPFRVAIVDWRLPGRVNGLELIHAIHRFNPKTVIISTTGMTGPTVLKAVFAEGVSCVLEKPVRAESLARAIERAWMYGLSRTIPLRTSGTQTAQSNARVLVLDNGQGEIRRVFSEQAPSFSIEIAESVELALNALKREPAQLELAVIDCDHVAIPADELVGRVLVASTNTSVIFVSSQPDRLTLLLGAASGLLDLVDRAVLAPTLIGRAARALAQKELRDQIDRLAGLVAAGELNRLAILDQHPDGLLVVEPSGHVRYANRRAETLLGRSSLELEHSHADELLGESCTLEIAQSLGRTSTVEIQSMNMVWADAPAQLYVLHDVTDAKNAEDYRKQLAHADRLVAVGQLAAGVAHEVNNPAAYVTANLDTMRRHVKLLRRNYLRRFRGRGAAAEGESQTSREVLTTLDELEEMITDNLEGMERIRSIVRDLRSFARLEEDVREEVDINEVVQIACNIAFNEIRHRARLVKDLGRVPAVVGDRGKLTQVLTNLLINAAHAIAKGTVNENQIKVTTVLTPEGALTITVEDTGKGIPEVIRARIFEPFFTTKPRDLGTGLGLSLCADIVRKHEGRIDVESEVGQGTRFIVTLPVCKTEDRAIEPNLSSAPPEGEDRIRVLLVDDEPMLLRSYTRMLRQDYNVVTAQGGQEAIQLLQTDRNFHAIVCDLMMPDLDGPSFYAWLREHAPELARRTIFCTGGAFTDATRAFVNEVSNLFLEKPLHRKDLTHAIDELVDGAPPPDDPTSARYLN